MAGGYRCSRCGTENFYDARVSANGRSSSNLATHLVKENAGGVHFLENLFFQGFPIRRCYPLQF